MNVPRTAATASTRAKARAKNGAKNAEKISDEAVRERIVAAAMHAFAEFGFHGTSIPEIAQAARVGVASIYRRFESKERLVNAVFRETKSRLRDALLLDLDLGGPPRVTFMEIWARLVRFQRAEPLAFQFLEMQDHVPYLDGESRAAEGAVLKPIVLATRAAVADAPDAFPPAVLIAMVWGAFVGITKAERLGYLAVDDATLLRAGEVCFTAIASTLPNLEGE